MRTKEYIIFLIIFTIAYIVFFIILDSFSSKNGLKKEQKRILSLFQENRYDLFANFYGIQGIASNDIILSIYEDMKKSGSARISYYSNKYGISSYEFVVACLYLEYLNLITKRNVTLESDYMAVSNYTDQNKVNKFYSCFLNHYDCQTIFSLLGNSAMEDLVYLNNRFLIPGVRYINSKMYYIGDICEKR